MAYLAIDLGAGSGRAILGTVAGGRLTMEEVHRFPNGPVMTDGTLRWDFPALMENVVQGIALAAARGPIEGIGVDAWGVDFGLLDGEGKLISSPVCYRDGHTRGMAAVATRFADSEEMYTATGIQQMEINTLYQLLARRLSGDAELAAARRLLFTPDLVNYMLTGAALNEYTIASTSQLLDARRREWADKLIAILGLRRELFGEVVQPGTLIGTLSGDLAARTGAGAARVFAVGSHDTASAIAAIPAEGDDWAFLSSGTWSLLGVPLDEPVLTGAALRGEFTNEGGVGGPVLFMRNSTGLWLLQRLIAEWEAQDGRRPSYDELLAESEDTRPMRSIIDGDDEAFTNPASMSAAICDFCTRTSQPTPRTRGEFVRCVMESLAAKYRDVAADIARCTGRTIRRLYVVGGGSRNNILSGYIAKSMGVEVVVGLAEATAAGNIMQQAIADGLVADWHAARRIIHDSFEWTSYKP